MPPAPILLFDSGVGGLSIAAAIATAMPGAPLAYACDNGFFPYGTKPAAVLLDRVVGVVLRAVDAFAPRLVVIACNTASTLALPRLRQRLAIPVVGVVPAIKPAAERSRTRALGLLGTPATVERAYTQALIDRYAADCTILRVGSAALVEMVESHLQGEPLDRAALGAILAPFATASPRVDAIVLACTHFPLVASELAAAGPAGVAWIDSAAAVARRVAAVAVPVGDGAGPASGHRLWFTARSPAAERLRPAFAARGFGAVAFA